MDNHGIYFRECYFSELFSFSNGKPVVWAAGTAQIGEGAGNAWGELEESEEEEEEEDEDEAVLVIETNPTKKISKSEFIRIISQDPIVVLRWSSVLCKSFSHVV